MRIGFLFWFLLLLWLIFGFWVYWPKEPGLVHFSPLGGSLLIFILFVLLGWRCFGEPIKE